MTDRARQAAEKWLAKRLQRTIVAPFPGAVVSDWRVATSTACARIAADFAERGMLAAFTQAVRAAAEQNKALMMEDQDALYRKMLPLPWAEATKEGGE